MLNNLFHAYKNTNSFELIVRYRPIILRVRNPICNLYLIQLGQVMVCNFFSEKNLRDIYSHQHIKILLHKLLNKGLSGQE